MAFVELAFQSKMLERQKIENHKNSLTYAAFVGWQNLIAKGYKETFDRYLGDLGLNDGKEKMTDAERKRVVDHAYETGQRVMNAFKGLDLKRE